MNNRKKLNKVIGVILVIFAMLHGSFSLASTLRASVDRNVISIAESFRLQLKATDLAGASEPDFSILENDFKILSRNVSHNYQSINGENSRSTSWQLQLQAKKIGEVEIPSFSLAGVNSQPVLIKIEQQKITGKENTDFDLSLVSNKTKVIEQEQTVVTLRFAFSKHVSNLQASELVLDNAQVIKLNDKQYETVRNGRQFGVYEVNYAVFADNPGEIIIPAQRIQVQLGRGSIFNNTRGKTIALQSNPLSIEVVSAAQNTQGFVVADSLVLEESWSGKTTLELGESITREISLKLSGAKAETITALAMNSIEDVKIYPEVANKDEKKTDKGLVTTRSRSFALVPTKAGKLVVPAFEITWWNTQENQFNTARLPAKNIEVIAPAITQQTSNTQLENNVLEREPEVEKVIEEVFVENPINQLLLIICALLTLLVLTLLWLLFLKKKKAEPKKYDNAPFTKQGGLDGQKEKALYQQIILALKKNNNAAVYHATQSWASYLQLSLQKEINLKEMLSVIEQQLYAPQDTADNWNKQLFKENLQQLRNSYLQAAPEKRSVSSLYPNYSGANH